MRLKQQAWIRHGMRGGIVVLALCAGVGCTVTPPKPTKDPALEIKRLSAACMVATGHKELVVMLIPKSSSAFTDKLFAVYSAAFDSTVVDSLTETLSHPEREAVLVSSENDEVAAAVLKRALSKLAPTPSVAKAPVCLAADERYQAEMEAAGQRVGVAVFVVQ